MRILHTSDWHIGRSLFDYSLLEEQRFFFRQLYDIIETEKVDALVVAGDLFDRSAPSAEAVALLDEVFSTLIHRCHIPVLAIAGNHDSPRRIDYGHALFEASGLYLEGTVRASIKKVTLSDELGPVNFFLLPYFVPQEIRLLLDDPAISGFSQSFARLMEANQEQFDPNQRNILVAHGFFMELGREAALSQSETAVGPSELTDLSPADAFDYVALGHLHGCQTAGRELARYSGSPLKYSVSEANQKKQVLLVDLGEKGNCVVTPLSLKTHRDLKVLTGTVEELLDQNGPLQEHREDFVYASLTDDSPVLHAMNRLRAVYPNILGLSFDKIQRTNRSADTLYNARQEPMEELFARFCQDITGDPLSEKRRETIHQLVDDMEQEDI